MVIHTLDTQQNGLNDSDPMRAFVAGLSQPNSGIEHMNRIYAFLKLPDTLLAQHTIYQLGEIGDTKAITPLSNLLEKLKSEDKTSIGGIYQPGISLEKVILDSLGKIGGDLVNQVFRKILQDPTKKHLHAHLQSLLPVRPNEYHKLKMDNFFQTDVPNAPETWKNTFPGVIEYLSGDGRTTTFKTKTKFSDMAHDLNDPFTDRAIYRSDPKVEYPVKHQRWSISHSYLSYPVIDGALYDKEYTWDVGTQTITTHFHEHVLLEKAKTSIDGKTLQVSHRPISTGVYVRENIYSNRCSSAVRGVWDNPEKKGKNYYVRRANIWIPPDALYYYSSRHEPILNQYGIWYLLPDEKTDNYFDSQGLCINPDGVIDKLKIPLHEPKILCGKTTSLETAKYYDIFRDVEFEWGQRLSPFERVPEPDYLNPYLGKSFELNRVGYAGKQQNNSTGYSSIYDINTDGIVDSEDLGILKAHQGEEWRTNLSAWGYFGFGWLSPGFGPSPTKENPYNEHIASYDYGAGYESETGTIFLFESPGINKEVWVEYHYDTPPSAGKENIRLYLTPMQ